MRAADLNGALPTAEEGEKPRHKDQTINGELNVGYGFILPKNNKNKKVIKALCFHRGKSDKSMHDGKDTLAMRTLQMLRQGR